MERDYLVQCWHCRAEFNALEVPFCKHAGPTKVCPFCLNCSCQATEEYKENFWNNAPKQLLEEKLIQENQANFKLGEILIRAGKITKNQLVEAIEKQRILKKRLGEIIVMMDLLTPEELELYLIDQKSIDEIDLPDLRLNMDLLERVGIDFCVLNQVIPLESFKINHHEILRLAIAPGVEPSKLKMEERIRDFTVIPYRAKTEDIQRLLKQIAGDQDQGEILVLEDEGD